MQRNGSRITQNGVITRTLGSLIYIWPLNVNQQKEIVFQDMTRVSSDYLKAGDWIQMEVECGDVVVYREKIEPKLPTFVTGRSTVRVKTRLYFPDGLNTNGTHIIGFSNDFGRVGIFFRCPNLNPKFTYDVWVSRPRRKHALLEEQYNTHWCLVRQTLTPSQFDGSEQTPLPSNWAADASEQFSNTLTENNINPQDPDFSYALNFNDRVLRRLYDNPEIREAIQRHNRNFAHSIELYLRTVRN